MKLEFVHISITPHPSSGLPSETIVSPRSSPSGKGAGRIQASNVSDAGAKAERLSALALNDEVPLKCSDLGAGGKDSLRWARMRLPGPVAFTAAALASRVGEGASDGIDDAPLLSVRLPVPRVPARARTFAVSRASRRACATRPSP